MNRWRLSLILFALLVPVVLSLSAQDKFPGPEGLLDQLFILRNTHTARESSWDKTGGNHDWIDLAPGQTKTLFELSGAGVIRRFYMAPFAADRMWYRKAVLRMYWDGQKDPDVEVPIGDFFGSGLGTLRYFKSLVVNINQGRRAWDFDGMVSYFPMPFEKGARITLENDGNVKNFRVWYHVDYEQYPEGAMPADAGRFHAEWHRQVHPPIPPGVPKNTTLGANAYKNTTGKDNYVVLDAKGKGTFAGLFLTVNNVAGGWYGEGDDMIFVDGAKWPPTYPGTGHEEIFNAGCCPDKEWWGPYTGFYLIENRNHDFGGFNQMYRFYLNAPIHFQKSIRFTIEHGHDDNFDNPYTSTAFWYQTDPRAPYFPLPAAKDRLPLWPADVSAAIDRETELENKLAAWRQGGKNHMSKADEELYQALVESRNKEFRKFDFQDYRRDVLALESLVNGYVKKNE